MNSCPKHCFSAFPKEALFLYLISRHKISFCMKKKYKQNCYTVVFTNNSIFWCKSDFYPIEGVFFHYLYAEF